MSRDGIWLDFCLIQNLSYFILISDTLWGILRENSASKGRDLPCCCRVNSCKLFRSQETPPFKSSGTIARPPSSSWEKTAACWSVCSRWLSPQGCRSLSPRATWSTCEGSWALTMTSQEKWLWNTSGIYQQRVLLSQESQSTPLQIRDTLRDIMRHRRRLQDISIRSKHQYQCLIGNFSLAKLASSLIGSGVMNSI